MSARSSILVLYSPTAQGAALLNRMSVALTSRRLVDIDFRLLDDRDQETFERAQAARAIVVLWSEDSGHDGLTAVLRWLAPIHAKKAVVIPSTHREPELPRELEAFEVVRVDEVSALLASGFAGFAGADRLKRALSRPAKAKEHSAPRASGPPARFTDVRVLGLSTFPPSQIEDGEPLKMGSAYALEVSVRVQRLGIGAGDRDRLPLPVPRIRPGAVATLLVQVESSDFEVTIDAATILLPERGDARRPARFLLTPRRPTNSATVNIKILYELNVIEVLTVRLAVVDGDRAGKVPPAALTQTLCFQSYEALEKMIARSMAVFVRAEGARYRVEFTVRDDRDREITVDATVDITATEMEDLLARFRAVLDDLAGGDFTAGDGSLVTAYDDRAKGLVYKLAEIGRECWVALFKRDASTAGMALGAWLEESPLPAGSIVQIAIAPDARSFVFPWALLFDAPVPKDCDLASLVGGFWGGRYAIEQRLPGAAISDEPVAIDGPLEAAFMVWKQFQNAAAQEALWQRLQKLSDGRLRVTAPVTSARHCVELLGSKLVDVLYFYAHGHTRVPREDRTGADPGAWLLKRYESLPVDSALRYALGPLAEQAKDGRLRGEGSFIELSFGRLYLKDLYDRIAALPSRPLVFLNMCESAQVTPSLGESFVHFFLNRGAPAVIGTECPMTVTFAHLFADAFFQRFLRGMTAGAALLEARQLFLARGNPLGLAYALFGSATLAYRPPCLASDAN